MDEAPTDGLGGVLRLYACSGLGQIGVQILALPLICCVTLDKALNIFNSVFLSVKRVKMLCNS